MSKEFFNLTQIAILTNLSESAVRAAIRRGELEPASHRLNGRSVWPGDVVSVFKAALNMPRPIADRRATLPTTAEYR